MERKRKHLNSSVSNMNGNTQSHQATVSVGFAQWGTVLGSLLFIFYVNDLPNALAFALLLYADYSVLR